MKILLGVVLLAAFWLPASAAPDAEGTHEIENKLIDDQEASYWREFAPRLEAIYAGWRSDYRKWRSDPETYKDEEYDLAELRALYEEYVALQNDRIDADRKLAQSGSDGAAEALFEALLDVAKETDAADAALAESRIVQFGRHDQEPPVRRHGLAFRLRGLVEALATAADGPAFLLATGWPKATKGDKKRSIVRRVAVLDALGAGRDEAAVPLLESLLEAKEPFLRIAAMEALVLVAPGAWQVLEPRLRDVNGAVRRALLQAVTAHGWRSPAWIPTVLAHYEQASGTERVLGIRALRRLTGQDFWEEPEKWRLWVEENRAAIDDGTFTPPEPKTPAVIEEEAPGPSAAPVGPWPAPHVTFYGLSTPSDGVVFILDGTDRMGLPADIEIQETRSRREWLRAGDAWRKDTPSHKIVLLGEMARTIGAMSPDVRFGAVLVTGGAPSRIETLGDRKLLSPSRSVGKTVGKMIEKPKSEGQMSCYEGFLRAYGMSVAAPRRDPKAKAVQVDTIFLLSTGYNGGRFAIPEALVAAFERDNRFRRLVVHAIRVCKRNEEAERLMRGLARVSGGAYDHVIAPPD